MVVDEGIVELEVEAEEVLDRLFRCRHGKDLEDEVGFHQRRGPKAPPRRHPFRNEGVRSYGCIRVKEKREEKEGEGEGTMKWVEVKE